MLDLHSTESFDLFRESWLYCKNLSAHNLFQKNIIKKNVPHFDAKKSKTNST